MFHNERQGCDSCCYCGLRLLRLLLLCFVSSSGFGGLAMNVQLHYRPLLDWNGSVRLRVGEIT